MKLSDLLAEIEIQYDGDEIVEGVTDRSYELEKNWLFVCLKGSQHDGHDHINYALGIHAFVLANKKIENTFYSTCTRVDFAKLVHAFYRYPCDQLTLIAVTGTNGKSTVTTLIRQLFEGFKTKSLLIGTNGIFLDRKYIETKNTTPDILTLVRLFDEAIMQNITYVIMEVSSQALSTHRVEGILFDLAILTNCHQDHLDYHKTLENYYKAKFKLFTQIKKNGVALINQDDEIGRSWISQLKQPVMTYGVTSNNFQIKDMNVQANQSAFFLNETYLQTQLISKFNIYNVVAVLATAFILDFNWQKTIQLVSELKPIDGRLQTIIRYPFIIWVDYAHTLSALESVLIFASEVKKARVITVFGCGGEREKEKRPKMGEIACFYSDLVILTMDNPRGENPWAIIRDIQQGCDGKEQIHLNRKEAIKFAIKSAQTNDIIIVAGKGSEQNQIVEKEIIAFDDEEVIRQILIREDLLCF